MMKPGTYWIGDLCYVMNDWDEVCDVTIDGNQCLSGEFVTESGIPFALYGTMFGDGSYRDNSGHFYGVDSGSIGCVDIKYLQRPDNTEAVSQGEAAWNSWPLALKNPWHTDLQKMMELGRVVTFSEEFETGYVDGMISIGNVEIFTGYASEEEVDEDDYISDLDFDAKYDDEF